MATKETTATKQTAESSEETETKDGKVIKPDGWEDPAPKIKAYIDAVIARKAQK